MYEHPVVSFHPSPPPPPPPPRNYTPVNEGYISVVDPGEGLGGPHPSYIRPNWGPESRKFFLRPPPPPPPSQGRDDRAPPFSEGLDLPLQLPIQCRY